MQPCKECCCPLTKHDKDLFDLVENQFIVTKAAAQVGTELELTTSGDKARPTGLASPVRVIEAVKACRVS